MKCRSCHAELAENANFCAMCGLSVHQNAGVCERCGRPWPQNRRKIFFILFFAGIFIALAYYLFLNYVASFMVLGD